MRATPWKELDTMYEGGMGCFASAPKSPATRVAGGPIGRFVSSRQPGSDTCQIQFVTWPCYPELTGRNPAALAVINDNVSSTFSVLLYDPPPLGFAENDKGRSAVPIRRRFNTRVH
jgi:hypothetical protein